MNNLAHKFDTFGDQYIRVIPDAVPRELCELIIKNFEIDTEMQHNGEMSHGYDPKRKKTTDVGIFPAMEKRPDLWQDIDDSLCKIVGETWQFYVESTELDTILASEFVDTCYQIQKYNKGEGYFKPHADASSLGSCKRAAACIMYLNDVILGGELTFPKLNFTVFPRAGTLIWFPASFTHVHEGAIPVSNDKYIITTFMEYSGEQ